MSNERISLSKLEDGRHGWGTNWRPVIVTEDSGERYWHGSFDHDENEHGEYHYITCHSDEMDYATELGELIADEHNAMPVLIAIAKAALGRQAAIDRDAIDEARLRCEKALLEAVRKVTK